MTDKIEVTQADREAADKAFDIAFQGDTATIDDDMARLFARHRLASTADAQPVAVQGLVEALERIADERTLQSDLPGLPWTAQDIAALQSREIVLMRDIARAALTTYQEQCDGE